MDVAVFTAVFTFASVTRFIMHAKNTKRYRPKKVNLSV